MRFDSYNFKSMAFVLFITGIEEKTILGLIMVIFGIMLLPLTLVMGFFNAFTWK